MGDRVDTTGSGSALKAMQANRSFSSCGIALELATDVHLPSF
jgi:hypothetical protein